MDDAEYWKSLSFTWDTAKHKLTLLCPYLRSARPGRSAMMTEEECAILEAMPPRLTVYRGYSSALHGTGHSWTLDKAIAVWFGRWAEKCGYRGRVLTGEVERSDVMAYLNDRDEKTIITNFEHVNDLSPVFVPEPMRVG